MFQHVPIKCPNCGKEVEALTFWKLIDGVGYHLCDACIYRPSEQNLFKIGFFYGYEKYRRELSDFLLKGE